MIDVTLPGYGGRQVVNGALRLAVPVSKKGCLGMPRIEIPMPVGLADSTIQSYTRRGDEFSVRIQLWNHQRARIVFSGMIGMRELGICDVSGLYETGTDEAFPRECLNYHFERPPEAGQYRTFEFLDLNANPALQIVAENCRMEIEISESSNGPGPGGESNGP